MMSSYDLATDFAPAVVPDRRPGKVGGVRAKNRAARTQVLCNAGLVVFLEHGVAAATVEQITRLAGVAKGSFYRYFSNKEQLVEAIFAPLVTLFDSAMLTCEQALQKAVSAAELNAAYTGLAEELAAQLVIAPDALRLYLQECRGPDEGARRPIRRLARTVTSAAIRITEVAHARGLLRPLPPQLVALTVVGAVERILVRYLDASEAPLDPAEMTGGLISLVVEGIRA